MEVLLLLRRFTFSLLFSYPIQVERPGTSNQGHHARTPAASTAHHLDAPEPADTHSGRRPHASAGAAGPLHQPGWSSFMPKASEMFSLVWKNMSHDYNHYFGCFFQTALLLKTQSPLFTEEPPLTSGSVGQAVKVCFADDKYVPPCKKNN